MYCPLTPCPPIRQSDPLPDQGFTDRQPHEPHRSSLTVSACVYGTKTTLLATGFLGFKTLRKHSAATQPVQVAVAALPIESSQRTLIRGRKKGKQRSEPTLSALQRRATRSWWSRSSQRRVVAIAIPHPPRHRCSAATALQRGQAFLQCLVLAG